MKRSLILLSFAFLSSKIYSQNIFPVKLNNCKTERFCLDCGDVKAGYDEKEFQIINSRLNSSFNLKGVSGGIKLQVLVDSKGKACVLSHTDQSNNIITQKIIDELNNFKSWKPAITNGNVEEKTSITLAFLIKDNTIKGQVERVDMNAFKKSFDEPKKPEIFNKKYNYKNENLNNYKITVWNSKNSNLPNNMTDHIAIDRNELIWLTVDEGLVKFDGNTFINSEQNITDKGKFFGYYELESDNNNIKWVHGKDNIYSFNDKEWTKYDPKVIGIDGAYEIINNAKTGEVFFCSDEGLTVFKDGKWSNINKDKVNALPSNRVSFAKRDSKNRIWIGTFSGSIMIDENGKANSFENSDTVLKGKSITSMDEDEEGNLYFTLYEFNRPDKQKINNNEGIAIRYNDGTIKQFTTENSGLPFNHANCILYDKQEKVVWISTDRAGLVRFDLKGNWENYHNENSQIPTSYISSMKFDKNGNLYLATRQGLVKIERKK
ncbi:MULTISPECIES: ligand-binding sensor domain-containing protein [unclassified Chryseobacterium]|uniref:ligand-binding sensor domain-containing protein n=1 Tax=unclassified Chryseobacterium TaxID=2593645 RepID=UPI00300FB2C3